MTNAEKYKYELRHILDMGHEIAVVDGEPTPCGWVDNCHKCAFVSDDAEPVRHGQLIITGQWECDDMGYVLEGQCSACNLYFSQYTTISGLSYKHCPRCGARLDGEQR